MSDSTNETLSMETLFLESEQNSYRLDSLGITFNNAGLIKFRNVLKKSQKGLVPIYTLPLRRDNLADVLNKLTKLFPYTKGVSLRLVSPQTRRSLIAYLNEMILNFVDRKELETSLNIIHELTANGEKANLENIAVKTGKASTPKEVVNYIRSNRKDLFQLCDAMNKWVKISWKFTHKIFKIEVRNNTPIDSMGLNNIKEKVSTKLNTLADGFSGEVEDKIGAGLGLFFVNFFKDEMKEKYNFETIFRIYESDLDETISSLTVMFEKD